MEQNWNVQNFSQHVLSTKARKAKLTWEKEEEGEEDASCRSQEMPLIERGLAGLGFV